METGKIILQTNSNETFSNPKFSPDGKTIASLYDHDVRFFNADSLKETYVLGTGDIRLIDIAFSPKEDLFATLDAQGNIKLWDLSTQKLLLTLINFNGINGKNTSLEWLAYSPDGYYNCSDGAKNLIKWRYNDKFFPASTFEKEYKKDKLFVIQDILPQ